MITRTRAIARSLCIRSPRLAGAVLAAAGMLGLAAPLAAAPVPPAAARAAQPGDGPIVQTSGGRKAAWIIGGLAALGAGAAIASQGRRVPAEDEAPAWGPPEGPVYGSAYPPAPSYPPPVYAPAPVEAYPYADDDFDYAPPPPRPVYPVGRGGWYRGSYADREPSVSVDAYGRRTRLLPEGR